MTAILYPREVICGQCGISIMSHWYSPFGRGSSDLVYKHPDKRGCEFDGELLKPTGMFAGVIEENEW